MAILKVIRIRKHFQMHNSLKKKQDKKVVLYLYKCHYMMQCLNGREWKSFRVGGGGWLLRLYATW